MKKILAIFAVTALLVSCSSNLDRGELVGAKAKNGTLKNLMG